MSWNKPSGGGGPPNFSPSRRYLNNTEDGEVGGEEEGEISSNMPTSSSSTSPHQQQQPPISPRAAAPPPPPHLFGTGGGGGGRGPRRGGGGGGWRGGGGGGGRFGGRGRGNVRHGSFSGQQQQQQQQQQQLPTPPLNKTRSQSFAGFSLSNRQQQQTPPPVPPPAGAGRPTDPRFRGSSSSSTGMNVNEPPQQQQQQQPPLPPPPPPPPPGRSSSSFSALAGGDDTRLPPLPPPPPFRDGGDPAAFSPRAPPPPPSREHFRQGGGPPLPLQQHQQQQEPPPPPPLHHRGESLNFRPDFVASDSRRGGRRGSDFRGGRGGGGGRGGPSNDTNYYGPARSPTRGRPSPFGRGGGGGGLPPPPLSRTGSFARRHDPRFAKDGGGGEQPLQHDTSTVEDTFFGGHRNKPPPLRRGSSADDAFGRTREWGSSSRGGISSPHASPSNRKPVLKFFQEQHPKQQQHPTSPGFASTSEKELLEPVIEEPPPPLLTTVLGEAHSDRAEQVVGHVCGLLHDAKLKAPEGQVSTLPTKQQIFTAMAKMDAKIKQAKKDLEEKKQEVAKAEEDEEAQRKKAKDDAIAEARRLEEERLRQEQDRQAEEEKAHEAEIQSYTKERQSAFDSEQETTLAELEEKLKTAKEEEEKKLREALNEQMITTADNFDKDIVKVRKELDRATQIAKKTENRLATVEKDYRAKVEQAEKSGVTEIAPKSHDLISTILAENRRRAAEAHMRQRMFVTLEEPVKESETVVALENAKDPKEGKTSAQWAQMSRNITGLKDAFYTEPSEAPYYEHNEQIHELIAPLVKEYIRDKHNRLTQHWVDLANEHEYRRGLYEKRLQRDHAHVKERPRKSVSIPVRQSILESGKPNKPILESGGGRSANPYRRARRGNEVRSEYEQEQIIAEIAAKEAMEKRITFGGCEMPRQIGPLENQLNGKFVNTFTAQKVDVMEQERQLAISNVWTDMEKAIFLDRWLQFPKDFRKIATFLRNKTTHDCVRFYYDSKQSIPYKGALREHIMRRKRRGDYHVWDATIEAALSVGATIEAGPSEEKPLIFYLPEDDHTYFTRNFHPLKRDIFDAMSIEAVSLADLEEDEELDDLKRPGRQKKRAREPLFTLDAAQKKYLKSQKDTSSGSIRKSQSRSSMAETDNTESSMTDEGPASSSRKAPQKWTALEKKVFLETYEKYGRNWTMLSQAIGTKSIAQIKNYYYDFKKQSGKNRSEKKSSRADGAVKAKQQDQDAKTPPLGQIDSATETPGGEAMSGSESSTAAAAYLPHLPHHLQNAQLHYHAPQLQHHHASSLQDTERSRSGTTTPDSMDLWALSQQQGLLQNATNEEAARLLLQHHSQTQHQHLLSNLLPWINAGHATANTGTAANSLQDWNDTQQLQHLLQMQQQQQNHHNPLSALGNVSLHSLGLGGLAGLTNAIAGLGQQQQQQHHNHLQQQQNHHQQQQQQQPQYQHHQTQQLNQHQQQQQQSSEDAQLALAQHLLNLHGQNGGSASDALALLARGLSDRNNNSSKGSN